MRFGINTIDDFDVKDKVVLCRIDINQPVDRETATLKSTARIEACIPTLKELSEKEYASEWDVFECFVID